MLVALLVDGIMSDTFGRKKIIYAGCVLVIVAMCITVFPKAFLVFIVCRVLIGMGSGTGFFKEFYFHIEGITSLQLMLHIHTEPDSTTVKFVARSCFGKAWMCALK